MKYFTLLILCLFGLKGNAQKIGFDYDITGNQIKREYCLICPDKNSNEVFKDIADISTNDLKKFSPNDDISFYPNPVKEQLYLTWDAGQDKNVSSINIYSLNGQLVKSFNNLVGKKDIILSFNQLSKGVYSVLLIYVSGDEKSIKIIKE